jgi:hypothetical protein
MSESTEISLAAVEPNVLDADASELIGQVEFFGVEDGHVFDLAAILEPQVNALITHAGFRQAHNARYPFAVEFDSHGYSSRILSRPVTVFGCVPLAKRTSMPPPGWP